MEWENKNCTTRRMLRVVYFGHRHIRALSPQYRSSLSKNAILGLGSSQAQALWIQKKSSGAGHQSCLWRLNPSYTSLKVICNTDLIMTFPQLRHFSLFSPYSLLDRLVLTGCGLIVQSLTQTPQLSGTSNSPTLKKGQDFSWVWSLLPCLVGFVCPNLSYS